MTRKELMELEVGTIVYNGRTEGEIKMDGNIKVIDIYIPISGMSNDSRDYDDRPENWMVIE